MPDAQVRVESEYVKTGWSHQRFLTNQALIKEAEILIATIADGTIQSARSKR
jgi:hypothetical protein